jgi:RNA polymerase sigma-70 factor, ECF subfamily
VTADNRAFLDATLPHLDVVHRVARHLSSDAASAEDLVQETYLRAFAKFSTHQGPNTRAWLITICVNQARSQVRQQRRRPVELKAEMPELLDDRPEVVDQVLAELDRADVSAALAQLAEPQRTALVLMDVAGLTASETAQVLGCPRGTILARAHRGRRTLIRLMAADREAR